MRPVLSAACISLSLLAILLAVMSRGGDSTFAPSSAPETLDSLVAAMEAMEERIAALEAAPGNSVADGGVIASSPPPNADEKLDDSKAESRSLAALEARLATLEDAEHIAQLAQSGRRKLRTKNALSTLAHLFEEDLSADERTARLKEFWQNRGRIEPLLEESGLDEGDAVLPVMELARDQSLDEGVRTRLLAEIDEYKVDELRQPLVDLLATDGSARLRQQAVRNLMGHAGDIEVQNAILRASRDDPSEEVRGTAQRRLAGLRKIAQWKTPGSPATQLTDAEVRAAEHEEVHIRVKRQPESKER